MQVIVFVVTAASAWGRAPAEVLSRNPVPPALSLLATFFGAPVLFILQQAPLLALLQILVYAGAIVV